MPIECKPKKPSTSAKLSKDKYDLIIVGGGPAGMGAAIYAARYKVKCAIISPEMGGLINDAHNIENYMGYNSISGADLTKKFTDHVKFHKVPIIEECVTGIKPGFKVYTETTVYQAKFVLIAAGLQRRKLKIPGEKEFEGKGITYCATCDAPVFRDLDVAIVGGGDGAASAAILASKYAKQVYMIYRKDKLRAEPYWQEQIKKTKNIKVIYKANVVEAKGEKLLKEIVLDTKKTLKVQGMIIEIGSIPTDALIKDLKIKVNEKGYIIVDKTMKTNIDRVYAAGDVNDASNNFRQISTAFGEAAVAANDIFTQLNTK